MDTTLEKARYNSAADFPYSYQLTRGCIYKTTKKPVDNIFPDLPTAQLHLLPDFAGICQAFAADKAFDKNFKKNVQKSADKLVEQFTLTPDEVREDGTFIVQEVSTPDAILVSVWNLIAAYNIKNGVIKTLKIGRSGNLVVYRNNPTGYLIGLEGDEDGVYLLHIERNYIFFYKGSDMGGGEILTKHSYQFLAVIEKALLKKEPA